MTRTHKCGNLTRKNVGENVILMGWVASKRDFGNLSFVRLRDVSGDVQIVFNAQHLSEQLNKKIKFAKI